ncbi:MAG: ABC transporter substrate-binding protein [Hydrogenophaga sp.]|uniref:ABC transporter substrate-binding protein n=1 Tax=Hydrogenophaga sp. TaxID=1904254 RepID=UPI0016AF4C28|nr:ABC transporter substrate-binding protein [Hydrogenophaga sp.]NIM40553.1 ABC transporter substrate-binding protein [Hydrogenophaga sp.]NIN25971.1 ABC transporter substrate-binding protein [Hydrogenophaga sp.]NIN30843.1 ABC transporter substrate-binding protein [Hydrogenophaga sp.]NIN54936.1 ABC transporter substrate-binding protein [Hydrogenophaga sp.]NIO50976.1 ABC transporter substrate-binding protein [Hydrogenophaga sp.]
MGKKLLHWAAASVVAAGVGSAQAQSGTLSNDVVRIGVLTDISGVYADISGKGAVEAVKMAVEDFGGKVFGKNIEVVFADHQNKADVGAAKAREWFDTGGVDMINDLANSGVALAVAGVAKEKKRHVIVNNASNVGVTNAQCSPYAVHYAYDAYSLAHGTGKAIAEGGGDTWFFLTVDFAFGIGLEQQVSEVVRANKGRVVGAARHPLGTTDFSSYVLQAQASKAKIVGLASTGNDTINAIKAAQEFGVTKNQKLAALLLWIQDVHSLGLQTAQGLQLTNAWYWDMNDESRAFARRFQQRVGHMPNMAHAGDYSSTMHYLKSVQAAGSDDPDAVSAKMRELPISDMFTRNGKIRADGRMVHDMYLWEVKSPAESKGPWDYLKPVKTIPAEQAFMPLSQSTCYLVKK